MDPIERDLQDVEWQAWQDVVKEFRAVIGDMNDPKYNDLIKLVNAWGESLSALKEYQTGN